MNTETTEMLFSTLKMFGFLAVELTILFLLISYIVGILQEKIPPQKIQNILSSKNGKGYVIAALLGAITPFCSCSTIPFLKGLIRAKAGFGTVLVFLFASPLLNPIIIGLLIATFSFKIAAFYFIVALGVSVLAGYTLEKLGFEKYIKSDDQEECASSKCGSISYDCNDDLQESDCPDSNCNEPKKEMEVLAVNVNGATGTYGEAKVETSCGSGCGESQTIQKEESMWSKVWTQTWKDFKKVAPYLFGGIAIGAFIYGFIPTEFIAKYAGADKPWAIPFSAIIGVPLYIRAEAVIPLSAALMSKGMGLGAVVALIIGSAGASLTEVILLKSIFKNKLIFAFLTVIFSMAIFAGYALHFGLV